VYVGDGENLSLIADSATAIPGQGVDFDLISFPSANGEMVAFGGNATVIEIPIIEVVEGVYLGDGNSLNALFETRLDPSSGYNFRQVSLEDGVVASSARESGDDVVVLVDDGGVVDIAREGVTAIPSGDGTFVSLGNASVSDGCVVFRGEGTDGQEGVYVGDAKELNKIVDLNDTVAGKSIQNINHGMNGHSRNEIVFGVTFTDETKGIVKATISGLSCFDGTLPPSTSTTTTMLPSSSTSTTTSISTSTTTTTISTPTPCGDPVLTISRSPAESRSSVALVTASDALFILAAAIGAQSCELCVCDVDNSGNITATDALLVLRNAVGEDIPVTCPVCGA
jgi:hypothetical protein